MSDAKVTVGAICLLVAGLAYVGGTSWSRAEAPARSEFVSVIEGRFGGGTPTGALESERLLMALCAWEIRAPDETIVLGDWEAKLEIVEGPRVSPPPSELSKPDVLIEESASEDGHKTTVIRRVRIVPTSIMARLRGAG